MKTIVPFVERMKRIKPVILLIITLFSTSLLQAQASLYFDGYTLISGTDSEVGAKYRFHQVMNNIDAIITIDSLVNGAEIKEIDQKGQGHECAFQPFIKTPGGTAIGYAVFTVEFVEKDNYNLRILDQVYVTPIDIDGNDKLKEFSDVDMMGGIATFSGVGTDISVTAGYYGYRGKNVAGLEYTGIDTLANTAMFTASRNYVQKLMLRAGTETVNANAVNRQHSFYMKAFSYINQVTLPVVLKYFSGSLKNESVLLTWEAEKEENFSHYILQRSYNGSDYDNIATIFGSGQTGYLKYSYTDASVIPQKGIAYYRLLMVDKDAKAKFSETRIIRFGTSKDNLAILTYPNPVTNELRITIPRNWQGKQVRFDLYNSNGQLVGSSQKVNASQTETVAVHHLAKGFYIIKASQGNETSQQPIVKN